MGIKSIFESVNTVEKVSGAMAVPQPTDCGSDQKTDRRTWFLSCSTEQRRGKCSSAQWQIPAKVELRVGELRFHCSSLLTLPTYPSASYPWASKQHCKCSRNSIMLAESDGRNWVSFEVGQTFSAVVSPTTFRKDFHFSSIDSTKVGAL